MKCLTPVPQVMQPQLSIISWVLSELPIHKANHIQANSIKDESGMFGTKHGQDKDNKQAT